MGMYTALRVKALIKPEYHALIQAILAADASPEPKGSCGGEPTGYWLGLDKLSETYPFLQELSDCEHGGSWLSWYIGGEFHHTWSPDDEEWQTSFKDGLLVFQSCMKNYDREYQKVAAILDIIAERIDYCAKWYEESWAPEKYVDGKWQDPPPEPGLRDWQLWSDDEEPA